VVKAEALNPTNCRDWVKSPNRIHGPLALRRRVMSYESEVLGFNHTRRSSCEN
jgi:hypothetical protein